ncbi:MAG: hypothetical protein AMXMBFR47_21820 [Planctomycetota bacterium]
MAQVRASQTRGRKSPTGDPRGRPADPSKTQARRRQILDQATRFFARHGYHSADMQMLADELAVGKGTLYRYFPAKEALFLAVSELVVTRMRTHIQAAVDSAGDDGLAAVAHAVAEYLRFFDSNPDCVEIMMLERSVFGDRRKPTYFAHREANAERWSRLYARLMDEGRIRRLPIEAIRDVISSAIYGAMFTNYFAGRSKPIELQAAQIIHVVLTGILTDAERARPQWRLESLAARYGENS